MNYLLSPEQKKQEALDIKLRLHSGKGNMEKVKYYLEKGARAYGLNNAPLGRALEERHYDVVRVLLENGAKPTAFNNSVIKFASRDGQLELVKYLHQNGADLDIAIKYSKLSNREELINYKKSMEEKDLMNEDLIEIMNNKTETLTPTKPKGLRV